MHIVELLCMMPLESFLESDNPPIIHKLKIELAITVDTGEPFVKATYRMERDGPLVFSAYEEISTFRSTISNPM